MFMNALLSPPLDQVTIVDSTKEVTFTALVEVSADSQHPAENWTVELWYGHDDRPEAWKAAVFSPAENKSEIKIFTPTPQNDRNSSLFTLSLKLQDFSPISFTLRLKPTPSSHWQWMANHTHIGDGHLVFQPSLKTQASSSFSDLFSDTTSDLSISSHSSQVANVEVFDVSTDVPALADQWTTKNLGTPTDLAHFYSLVKVSSPWMGPRQGSAPFSISEDGLMLGYLRSDGRHVCVLCVSGLEDTTTFVRSSDSGQVLLKARNDGKKEQKLRAVVTTGWEDRKTVDAAFYRVKEMQRAFTAVGEEEKMLVEKLVKEKKKEKLKEKDVGADWFESWYDGLAYCTWNGLGRELSQDKILEALQELDEKGVRVTTLIVDDNWQSLDANTGWDRFEANSNFPNGLAGLTSAVRLRFKYIKHISVWHALLGYWGGISPSGWIAQNYKTSKLKRGGGHDITVVEASDVSRLYNDFYAFLAASGVDSTKCDNQAGISELDHAEDRERIDKAYQDAFKIASLRHLQRRVIYCMCQIPSIFFHSLLPTNAPAVLFRNSDDFYPNIPSSHLWHVFANFLNNIFTSHLNGLPDFDMFQTSLPTFASFHAAARCISGGPIYITDAVGSHDLTLLNSMIARSPRGNTVILRPSTVALPIDPFVRYNSNQLLKVEAFHGRAGGMGLVGAFNVREDGAVVEELLLLKQFPGVQEGEVYTVFSYSEQSYSEPLKLSDAPALRLALPHAGWDVLSAVRLYSPSAAPELYIGPLGLVDKISGAAAIETWSAGEIEGERIKLQVSVKALGVLGVFVGDLENRKLEGLMVTLEGRPVPFETVKGRGIVLEVDLVRAWEELGLEAGWANEVAVVVWVKV